MWLGKYDPTANFFKVPSAGRAPKRGLKPVSKKREKQNKTYEQNKRLWRLERMALDRFRCQFKDGSGRCKRTADRNPHHIARRGKRLCDIDHFMAVCLDHHRWIEANGKEAEKLGYLKREYREKSSDQQKLENP
jgi:hypothetical protein